MKPAHNPPPPTAEELLETTSLDEESIVELELGSGSLELLLSTTELELGSGSLELLLSTTELELGSMELLLGSTETELELGFGWEPFGFGVTGVITESGKDFIPGAAFHASMLLFFKTLEEAPTLEYPNLLASFSEVQ